MWGGDLLLGAVVESKHLREDGAKRTESLFLPETTELEFSVCLFKVCYG